MKQMKSMGWSEGKGLGLAEDGITKPVKPNVQLDTRGLGFSVEDSIQVNNHWWSDAYNAASKGQKTKFKITSVGVIVQDQSSISDSQGEKKKSYMHHFVSAGVNAPKQENTEDQTSESAQIKKTKSKKEKLQTKDKKIKKIDFNQVFSQNNGVTCHKAARLGINMGGKLKRIEEQEQNFLKKLRKL